MKILNKLLQTANDSRDAARPGADRLSEDYRDELSFSWTGAPSAGSSGTDEDEPDPNAATIRARALSPQPLPAGVGDEGYDPYNSGRFVTKRG